MPTTIEELARSFKTTHWLLHKFTDGMSHEESVLSPSFSGNSFNWVFGHIVEHRDQVLDALGKQPVLDEAEADLYRTGSEPVTEETDAVNLERLLEALDQTQERIVSGLEETDAEMLAAIYDADRGQTVGERIAGLHWHESYHLGQLEILRQVSGPRPAFP